MFGDLSVSRGFGDFHYKEHEDPMNQFISPVPEVISFARKDVKLIFMGCDGIWERKEVPEIMEDITAKIRDQDKKAHLSNPEKLGNVLEGYLEENIASTMKDFNGKDNMSAILIKFHS